jgi:hypothetical protein
MAQFLASVPLPPEVLIPIVQELDPITLISLSQTSRGWRAFIRPIKHDFIQRLLALELHPDYGGLTPTWDEDSQRLDPPCEDKRWKTAKYACCGCMKLLTHMMFDNHAILRRHLRKPPPGYVEAEKALRTDWEPVEPALRWQRIQARAAKERDARKRWVRMIEWYREDSISDIESDDGRPRAFENGLPPSETREEALRHVVGDGRSRRRCLECQRKSGRLRRVWYPDLGELPMVPSRQMRFRFQWDRWIPGLFKLPPEEASKFWKWFSISPKEPHLRRAISLYVGWCHVCKTWREGAAFFRWFKFRTPPRSPYFLHKGDEGDAYFQCLNCSLEKDDDYYYHYYQDLQWLHDKLTCYLADTSDVHYMIKLKLGGAWAKVRHHVKLLGDHPDADYLHDEVLPEVPETNHYSFKHGHFPDDELLPDLHEQFRLYRDYIPKMDPKIWRKLWPEDYMACMDYYDELMDLFYQQKALVEKAKDDLFFFCEYILHHDPYRPEKCLWW